VTDSLRERLERTLGSAYAIDRELAGGGMSRVFVATETESTGSRTSRCPSSKVNRFDLERRVRATTFTS